MAAILTSILIFGWVHPGSKLLLESGVPLSFFCVLYIGIRLLALLPLLALSPRKFFFDPKKQFLWLLGFGLIGASLQFFEFAAIDQGLSPGTVTFLMYTYPIWILLGAIFSKRERDSSSIWKMTFLLGGLVLVTGASLQEVQGVVVLYPVLAGVAIAFWVLLSRRLRQQGMSSLALSFYYDAFSLATLLLFLGQDLWQEAAEFTAWFTPSHALAMVGYSLLVGLLPNLLFYAGSKTVSAKTSSLLMAFEPVLSTSYALFLWKSDLSGGFYWGAILILVANLPLQSWSEWKKQWGHWVFNGFAKEKTSSQAASSVK